jgi:hypothetical protein
LSHINSGNCPACLSIFEKFPGFYEPLKNWFFDIQSKNPTFHISCAGRGQVDQEAAFARGASKAHWLQSSHNFNAAIDTFFLINGQYRLDHNFYDQIAPQIDGSIDWYGKPGSPFPERPHFEIANWRQLVADNTLKAVE